jgi:hypothetical protein
MLSIVIARGTQRESVRVGADGLDGDGNAFVRFLRVRAKSAGMGRTTECERRREVLAALNESRRALPRSATSQPLRIMASRWHTAPTAAPSQTPCIFRGQGAVPGPQPIAREIKDPALNRGEFGHYY